MSTAAEKLILRMAGYNYSSYHQRWYLNGNMRFGFIYRTAANNWLPINASRFPDIHSNTIDALRSLKHEHS